MKQECHGSFSYDDGTILSPKSAVTGDLSEDDKRNVEIEYRKRMDKAPQGMH